MNKTRTSVIALGALGLALSAITACSAFVSFDGLAATGASDDAGADARASSVDGAVGANDGSAGGEGGPTATATPFIAAMGGGDGSAYRSDVFVARVAGDGSLGVWASTGNLPVSSYRGAATALGLTMYLLPGSTSSSTYTAQLQTTTFIDGGTTTYRSVAPFTNARYRAALVSTGNTLVLAGGATASDSSLSDVRWATLNGAGLVDTWHFGPDMPTGRSSPCAAVWQSHVYVMGGSPGQNDAGVDGRSASTLMASVAADGSLSSWQNQTTMPVSTQSCAAAAANGYVYVTGGYTSGNQNAVQFASIAADGSLSTWAQTASLNHGRALHAMVAVGNYLYVIGGDAGAITTSVEVAHVEPDGSIGAWTDSTPLPAQRAGLSAVTFSE